MQTIMCARHGPPDDLRLRAVPTPTPHDHDLLSQVHAATSGDVIVMPGAAAQRATYPPEEV